VNTKAIVAALLTAGLLAVAGCGQSTAVAVTPAGSGEPGDSSESSPAAPLISGTVSWVDGRHVWTDYAYDDRGRTAAALYPSGVYRSAQTANAADLIQLQLALDDDALTIHAVLETLEDASLPLLGIGLDLDGDPQTGAADLPGGSWTVHGTPLGLERLIVVSAAGTRVLRWNHGAWRESPGPAARLDADDNTIDVAVPRDALGATAGSWRAVGVLGLTSDPWTDGGAIYDLAYVRDPSAHFWQSGLQADILGGREDAAQAVATIATADFAQHRTALAQPQPGHKETFLYRSQLQLGEGLGSGDRKYAGPYQPYAAWFPESGLPAHPPLIVFLHGALQNHLSGPYGDIGALEFGAGKIDPSAVIVTPLGRGEVFGFYTGAAEQDVLDVLADAQRRFGSDPDRTVLSGYSLGGVGTFNLAQLYPDRWAGAIDIVGAPDLGVIERLGIAPPLPYTLENLRNLPFRMAHSRLDELQIIVGVVQPDIAALKLDQLGYDYRYWQFYLRDHLFFPVPVLQCEYDAAIARGRVVDPARVVYSQEPALRHDEADSGLVLRHDAAYWMSEMVVRGDAFAPGDKGTLDITSLALADREPKTRRIAGVEENLGGGRDVCGENPDVRTHDIWTVAGIAWDGFDDAPLGNGIVARLERVSSVTLDVARMGLDTEAAIRIDVSSDGDSRLRLKGAWHGAGRIEQDGEDPVSVAPANDIIDIAIGAGTHTLVLQP
jgi:hypothetical protein